MLLPPLCHRIAIRSFGKKDEAKLLGHYGRIGLLLIRFATETIGQTQNLCDRELAGEVLLGSFHGDTELNGIAARQFD